MSTLGIDVSTKAVDLVVLQDDTNHADWTRISLATAEDALAGARLLRHSYPRRGWFEDHGITLVAIEDPFSDKVHAAKALGRIVGAIAALTPPELPIRMIAPQTWRKHFLGQAKADKADAWIRLPDVFPDFRETWMPELRRHHPRKDTFPDDVADAYAAAWAARELASTEVEKPEPAAA